MKHLLLITSLFISMLSYSQVTTVTQEVKHGSSTANTGCISVRLEVNYTLNGLSYTNVGSTVSLDPSNSTTLTANIPSAKGLTIISKQVRIYGSGDNHLYTIQNTTHDYYYDNSGVDVCTATSSDWIHEIEYVSPSKFEFGTDALLGN